LLARQNGVTYLHLLHGFIKPPEDNNPDPLLPKPAFSYSLQNYLPVKSIEDEICKVSMLIHCGEAQDELESSDEYGKWVEE